jgi:hypothetical protein
MTHAVLTPHTRHGRTPSHTNHRAPRAAHPHLQVKLARQTPGRPTHAWSHLRSHLHTSTTHQASTHNKKSQSLRRLTLCHQEAPSPACMNSRIRAHAERSKHKQSRCPDHSDETQRHVLSRDLARPPNTHNAEPNILHSTPVRCRGACHPRTSAARHECWSQSCTTLETAR